MNLGAVERLSHIEEYLGSRDDDISTVGLQSVFCNTLSHCQGLNLIVNLLQILHRQHVVLALLTALVEHS